jgi:hypothetical protein
MRRSEEALHSTNSRTEAIEIQKASKELGGKGYEERDRKK